MAELNNVLVNGLLVRSSIPLLLALLSTNPILKSYEQ